MEQSSDRNHKLQGGDATMGLENNVQDMDEQDLPQQTEERQRFAWKFIAATAVGLILLALSIKFGLPFVKEYLR